MMKIFTLLLLLLTGFSTAAAQNVQTVKSIEEFLKAHLKAGDRIEFEAGGDLNNDSIEDWAGIVARKKAEAFIENGAETFSTVQLYILLRQNDGGYTIAGKSKESGVFGAGGAYLEDLRINRASVFLQMNGSGYASFSQFKFDDGEWRLIGWREVRVDAANDKLFEIDRNLLTGAVVEKRQTGERRPTFRRYRKKFPRHRLEDYDLFGVEIR